MQIKTKKLIVFIISRITMKEILNDILEAEGKLSQIETQRCSNKKHRKMERIVTM